MSIIIYYLYCGFFLFIYTIIVFNQCNVQVIIYLCDLSNINNINNNNNNNNNNTDSTWEATAQGRLASVPPSNSSSSSSSSYSSSSLGGVAMRGKTTEIVGTNSLFFTSACGNVHCSQSFSISKFVMPPCASTIHGLNHLSSHSSISAHQIYSLSFTVP